MENKYTIEEIRNYILSQESLGDVLYNLKDKNIKDANVLKVCKNCCNNFILEHMTRDENGERCFIKCVLTDEPVSDNYSCEDFEPSDNI